MTSLNTDSHGQLGALLNFPCSGERLNPNAPGCENDWWGRGRIGEFANSPLGWSRMGALILIYTITGGYLSVVHLIKILRNCARKLSSCIQ